MVFVLRMACPDIVLISFHVMVARLDGWGAEGHFRIILDHAGWNFMLFLAWFGLVPGSAKDLFFRSHLSTLELYRFEWSGGPTVSAGASFACSF